MSEEYQGTSLENLLSTTPKVGSSKLYYRDLPLSDRSKIWIGQGH